MQKKSAFFSCPRAGVLIAALLLCSLLYGCAGLFGGPKPGHFSADTLPMTLNQAANRVEDGLDISSMLSEVRLGKNTATVDFIAPSFPRGISFVLSPLADDKTSNTLAFKISLAKGQPEPDGMLAVACAAIIMEASQPGQLETLWSQLEDIFGDGGQITINNWQYRCTMEEDNVATIITFSATAPLMP